MYLEAYPEIGNWEENIYAFYRGINNSTTIKNIIICNYIYIYIYVCKEIIGMISFIDDNHFIKWKYELELICLDKGINYTSRTSKLYALQP